jgi:hypothetical protein
MFSKAMYILTFALSSFAFGQSNLPHFGLSGEYFGSIQYSGNQTSAKTQIVQHGDTIRGIVTAEIEYVDVNGEVWKSASLLFKGKLSEKKVYFSDYQCSAVVELCETFGHAQPDFVADIEFTAISGEADYTLFEVSFLNIKHFSPNGSRPLPFESNAKFSMESTFSSEPIPNTTLLGSWGGLGYFPDNYVVLTPVPFFLEWDLTFYKDYLQKMQLRSFTRTSLGWALDEHHLVSYEEGGEFMNLALGANRFFLKLDSGVVYGRVYHDVQLGQFFDFFGLFWMMPN